MIENILVDLAKNFCSFKIIDYGENIPVTYQLPIKFNSVSYNDIIIII